MKTVRESVLGLFVVLMGWQTGTAAAQSVSFPDPNLEAAVRSALAIPSGPITQSNMAQLVSLPACCLNITDLAGLQSATNLTSLDLSGNLITDLSPLAPLSNLTYLNAGANQITNLNALSGMTLLDGLWLYQNPLRTLAPLTNLTHLSSLFLYSSSVTNITPLAGLTNLKYLELRWNPLTNAQSALAGLTNLTTLYLGGTSVTNASFLQSLTHLTDLYLDHNQILNLSPLASLPELKSLDVGYNPLTNSSQIVSFVNLTNLYLSGHSISNMAPFTNLSGLSLLMLVSNRVSDLSPLAQLPNLHDLGLSWNPITNHAAIAGLSNLVFLRSEGNSLSNLSFVEGLSTLKALSFGQNQVDDLSPLTGLTNLVAVLANYNRVTNISMLEDKVGLVRVQLIGNLLDLTPGYPAMNTIESLWNQGAEVEFDLQNSPPSIAAPSSWNISTNKASQLGFEVYDDVTSSLVVTAVSSDTNLIPAASISVTGTGRDRTLTATPVPNQTGIVTIVLTVTDAGGQTASANVTVNVVVPQAVSIPDPGLEYAIRLVLNKPTGGLTSLDLESLTYLSAVDGHTISNLTGLNLATNLAWLHLKGTAITNFTPLQDLHELGFLLLADNRPADLSPLSGLTKLSTLILTGDSITNIDFVANLTGLTSLILDSNWFSNITPLGGLTNLGSLSFQQNLVSNIDTLLNMPSLGFVDMRFNILNLETNPGPITVIETLSYYLVQMIYFPQRGPPEIGTPSQFTLMRNTPSVMYFGVLANGVTDVMSIGAKSSNTNIIANEQLIPVDYDNYWKTVTMIPKSNAVGTTTVTVSVTNDLGFVSQKNVLVSVMLPTPFTGSVLNSSLSWQTGGNAPWFSENQVTHDGVIAAQSGAIDASGVTWLETTVTGPGALSFWWKVSSATNSDWLDVRMDGAVQTRISGEVNWEQRTFYVLPGIHTFRWQYSKSLLACCPSGSDAGWLDQVSYSQRSWLKFTSFPTNGQTHLTLYLYPGKVHEVFVSTNLTNWASLGTVPFTNTSAQFHDFNATSRFRFYRLRELP